jgi:hypothetical protein
MVNFDHAAHLGHNLTTFEGEKTRWKGGHAWGGVPADMVRRYRDAFA